MQYASLAKRRRAIVQTIVSSEVRVQISGEVLSPRIPIGRENFPKKSLSVDSNSTEGTGLETQEGAEQCTSEYKATGSNFHGPVA